MALRLAGEEVSVVRGLDALGWPREVEANDASPGLKITQSGSGPALQVVSGDIALGANKLKTTTTQLVEMSYNTLAVRNATDSDYQGMRVGGLGLWMYGNLDFQASGNSILALNADDSTILIKARDNGVGMVEVARLQGQAEPRFKFSLPSQLYTKTDTGDPTGVEGDLYVNLFDNALRLYADGAWRTVISWV